MALAIGGNQINKAYLGTTEIQKMYLGSELVFDNSAPPVLLTPIMTNFRVEDANKDRVYFDTPLGPVTGIDLIGFVISQKIIIGVNTTDNYFTVDSAFNFWDNNTIRLGEVTDTSDSQTVLYNFTLEDIDNNIPEPDSVGDIYFVNAGATGNGSGSSEANGFTTLQAGFNAATGDGDIIYMKTGTYTTSSHTETNNFGSSDSNNPVKLIGYKTTPGDLDGVRYYSYTNGQAAPALDPSEMPLMEGNKAAAWAIQVEGTNNTIIRNIQFHGYRASIRTLETTDSINIIIDNCISDYAIWNDGSDNEGVGFWLENGVNTYSGFRIINSLSMNAGMINIGIIGSGNRVKNCNTYSDNSTDSGLYGADYQISVRGSDNVTTHCLIEALLTGNSQGHGLACRSSYSSGEKVYNNLFQHVELNYQCNESIQARNYEANFNVFKDIQITGYSTASQWGVAMQFQTGAQWNVFERITVDTMYQGIGFITGNESGSDPALLHTSNNLVRNSTFNNIGEALMTWNTSPTTATYEDNSIINCTFNDVDYFHRGSSGNGVSLSGNKLIDCILEGCTTENVNATAPQLQSFWSFEEANIHSSWATSIGTDSSNLDPQFTGNLLPTNESLMSSRDSRVRYDLNEKQREDIDTTKGAVTLASENAGTQPPITVTITVSNTDGTADFSTIQAAVDSGLVAGDIVGLKGGDEFFESVSITGLTDVIFTSYGTGQAIIKGSEAVSGWLDEGSNIWSITEANTVYQTFKNGVKLNNGNTPNTGYYQVTAHVDGTDVMQSDDFKSPTWIGDLIGGYVHINGRVWSKQLRKITAFNNSTGEITMEPVTYYDDELTGKDFFVNNHKDLLTSQDQFAYDEENDKLYVYSVGSPADIDMATINTDIITLTDSSNVTIDNIEIKEANQNAIKINTSTGIVVSNNTFNYFGLYGLYSVAGEFTLDSNIIKGSTSVLYSKGLNTVVTNNTISDIGVRSVTTFIWTTRVNGLEGGVGIQLDNGSDSALVSNNNLNNIGSSGIHWKGVNSIVEENNVNDFCMDLIDGGGIYTVLESSTGSIIRKNTTTLTDQADAYTSVFGIYLDDLAVGITVEDNTVSNTDSGIFLHNAKDNIVQRNNIYTPARNGILLGAQESTGGIDGYLSGNDVNANQIYSESSTYMPVKLSTTFASGVLGFSTFSNNYYINPNSSNSVKTSLQGVETDYSLSAWQSYSGEDAGTIDDSVMTIGQALMTTNPTSGAVINDLPTGTWSEFDGTEHTTNINVPSYSSFILTNEVGIINPNPELVDNWNFELGDVDWTKGAGVTISGNVANINYSNDYGFALTQDIAELIDGSTYEVELEVLDHISGTFRISLGGNSSAFMSSADTYKFDLVADSDLRVIIRNSTGTLENKINYISIKLK